MKNILAILAGILLTVVTWTAVTNNNQQKGLPVVQEKQTKTFMVKQTVELPDKPISENVEAEAGETALDVLKKTIVIETDGEGVDAFVTSINKRKADGGKQEFWAFYVNGKQAPVGAGSYKVQPKDTITWKLETY
jgi:hypothetical protein